MMSLAAMVEEPAAALPFTACGFLLIALVFMALAAVGLAVTIAIVVAVAKRSGRAQRDEITAAHREYALLANGVSTAITGFVAILVFVLMLGWALPRAPGGLLVSFFVCMLAVLVTHVLTSNWVSLVGNGRLRRRVVAANPKGGWFVGIAHPQEKSFYNQFVDTHDDFGLMRLEEQALVFDGVQGSMSIPRGAVRQLRRPLVWQFAYLGCRWLELHWQDGEAPRVTRFGSREGKTLLASERHNDELAEALQSWGGMS